MLIGEEGRRDAMLSSPIILYDHPTIAPESPGDLFDATEIDEILTLRTMALTEDEKREARATDERAAAIIDRVDNMPPELLERLHGAVRYLQGVEGGSGAGAPREGSRRTASPPSWCRGGTRGRTGRCRRRPTGWWWPGSRWPRGAGCGCGPGQRRADAQDMFLAGREATVEAVFLDVDGNRHLAVTLDEDPAADLQRWHGRYLYFSPDEVEPLEPPRS